MVHFLCFCSLDWGSLTGPGVLSHVGLLRTAHAERWLALPSPLINKPAELVLVWPWCGAIALHTKKKLEKNYEKKIPGTIVFIKATDSNQLPLIGFWKNA